MLSKVIFHDVEQNTDKWFGLRLGKLTGSNIGKVMANFGEAFGEPAKKLAVAIAVEQVTGKLSVNESYSNGDMSRGQDQEPLAIAAYENQTFCTVSNGGFFELGNLGSSPDGRVYKDGIVEAKSVISSAHYDNIRRNDIDPTYRWQFYFNLVVTGMEWIDFISYCADFPEDTQLFAHRVYREDINDEYNMMINRIDEFFNLVEKSKLIVLGSAT